MSDGNAAASTPRRRDGEVLEAATKVFHERGYAAATVQDVADELGILKGSLYYYINSKEDLLSWLVDDVHENVEVILGEAMAREELAPLERLSLYVRRQAEHSLANLPRITVYYHDVGRLSEDRLRDIRRRRRAHEVWVAAMIREAQERGEVGPDLDAALLTKCLFGALIWIYRWYRPDGDDAPAEVVDHVTRFALAGVVGAGNGTWDPT